MRRLTAPRFAILLLTLVAPLLPARAQPPASFTLEQVRSYPAEFFERTLKP